MDAERSSLCNFFFCQLEFLVEENYLLTAFELLHELLDAMLKQFVFKEFFSDQISRYNSIRAQREKTLDKQLHSLIEQLAAKQAQAEGIVREIHLNEIELERLNSLWRRYESFNVEGNAARNRFKRTNSDRGFGSDQEVDAQSYLPYTSATKNETQTRLMYFRSAFVVYILALHVLVFIKISF